MRHGLIIMAFMWLGGLACGGQTLTLKECIDRGIAGNIALLGARTDIEKGRTGISQNRARLLPTVSGVFQFTDYLVSPVNVTTGTLLGNDFPDHPSWQTIRSMQYNANAGVQLSVPVYNRSIFASIDVARTISDIAGLSYEKGVEDLTVQIARVYYQAQASRRQAMLIAGDIERMDTLYAITEALYDQGVVMEVDLNRVDINRESLRAAAGQWHMLHEQHLNMLRFLMDMPPESGLSVTDMPDSICDAGVSGVDASLPELMLARRQLDLADSRIRAVKAGYVPSVSFTAYAGGIGYQEKFGDFFHTSAASRNWFGNCFVGLNVHIPLFDANSRRFQIRQHRHDRRKAEYGLDQLQKQLTQQYDNALLQLRHSREVYVTQSRSCRQAESVYSLTEIQYKEGVAPMTALLQDEMQLRAAQSSCVQAQCQFNMARLELLRLSGNLAGLSE